MATDCGLVQSVCKSLIKHGDRGILLRDQKNIGVNHSVNKIVPTTVGTISTENPLLIVFLQLFFRGVNSASRSCLHDRHTHIAALPL